MKIRITVKGSDSVSYSINDAINKSPRPEGIDDEEWNMIRDERMDSFTSEVAKWVRYNEYVVIEIDTETHEARVVPAKDH